MVFKTAEGDRFCADCRKAVRSELKAAGFLQVLPYRRYRGGDQMAAIDREPNPWGENAVRSMEGD